MSGSARPASARGGPRAARGAEGRRGRAPCPRPGTPAPTPLWSARRARAPLGSTSTRGPSGRACARRRRASRRGRRGRRARRGASRAGAPRVRGAPGVGAAAGGGPGAGPAASSGASRRDGRAGSARPTSATRARRVGARSRGDSPAPRRRAGGGGPCHRSSAPRPRRTRTPTVQWPSPAPPMTAVARPARHPAQPLMTSPGPSACCSSALATQSRPPSAPALSSHEPRTRPARTQGSSGCPVGGVNGHRSLGRPPKPSRSAGLRRRPTHRRERLRALQRQQFGFPTGGDPRRPFAPPRAGDSRRPHRHPTLPPQGQTPVKRRSSCPLSRGGRPPACPRRPPSGGHKKPHSNGSVTRSNTENASESPARTIARKAALLRRRPREGWDEQSQNLCLLRQHWNC